MERVSHIEQVLEVLESEVRKFISYSARMGRKTIKKKILKTANYFVRPLLRTNLVPIIFLLIIQPLIANFDSVSQMKHEKKACPCGIFLCCNIREMV